MNLLIAKLKDLKENYNAIGIKAEFETEGCSNEDIIKLKEISIRANLDLSIKTGGCGALKDLRDMKKIGVSSIIAPMIESEYALKKFIKTVNTVFSKEEFKNLKLYINIETINGYNSIDEIFESDSMKQITGIVFGRGDMAKSLGLENCEEETILKIGKKISEKCCEYNKTFIIGGKITPESLKFLDQINYTNIETRKVIFDSNITAEGIIKAIEFEIMWIKNKQIIFKEDETRINELEKRYKNLKGVYE